VLITRFCRLVGIPSTGGAGIINTIRSFTSGSIVTGVFCVIATVGWAVQTFVSVWLYRSVWAHKNAEGHNFNQAKSEFQQQCVGAPLFFNSLPEIMADLFRFVRSIKAYFFR
jgi:hypothetical protein